MSTLTVEKPTTPAASPTAPTAPAASNAAPRPAPTKAATLLLGLDLGTNKSCVLAGPPNSSDITVSKIVPSVVGYVKDGIVDGIIAGNARILYGEDALDQMLHVDLATPLAEGVIAHP